MKMTKLNCPVPLSFFTLLSFLLLTSSQAFAAYKIGLILDRGGRDDKSFNSAAYQGLMKAEKDLKIQYKLVESSDDHSFEPMMRAFAQRKFDLIICVGFSQADALKKIAPSFKDTKFVIVDGQVDGPNVRSLLFEEHQGSFLVGALAALTTKTKKIGFIGGMDIPLIRRFRMGYEAGIKYIDPKITLTTNYLGFTADSWNNPPKAKELALAQYQAGVDIIFAPAGASNLGLFDAAEEKKKLAIGVDSNQNWIRPGYILTSMMKRVDVAVFETIKELTLGRFTSGVARFGLKDGGVDFSQDQHNKKLLSADVLKKVDQIKKDIISGKIQVPDYYLLKK
jgi:basic membrane protein A